MRVRKSVVAMLLTLALALALGAIVRAGSVTVNGATLTWPEYPVTGSGFVSCEPWFESQVSHISLTGIPAGANVMVQFAYSALSGGSPIYATPINYSNVVTGSLNVPVSYPDTDQWPVWNEATQTKAIALAVFVQITPQGGTAFKLTSKKWWIKCGSLPPPPAEGCTLGYWKTDAAFHDAVSWGATGYAPSDNYNTVFGVTAGFTPHTLLDALNLGGGGERALARQGTAALLNAASPEVDFAITTAEVIAIVQEAYAAGTSAAFTSAKNTLEFYNEGSGQGHNCPLDHGNSE